MLTALVLLCSIYPVAATVNAKPGTTQCLAFLRSAAAK